MQMIRTAEDFARALSQPPDPELPALLQAQADRLAQYADFAFDELAMFAIVENGDTLNSINAATGWSLLKDGTFDPPVEVIAKHSQHYEVTFILSDDGYGLIFYVPTGDGTDGELLAACERALSEQQEPNFP